ncbi:arginine exporter protein ArgO [Prauserella sediminis]|uniref:Arginine exporter protein ArgO n=1 Tax=Prauserella sediminis TaxID=577680 RepID=A0A839XGC9_9PSEU|nr:LysE family transporter [Prauserella sediminis]MBB3662340.1 arginine exporter protein ArgO [Prauserella sediminis]
MTGALLAGLVAGYGIAIPVGAVGAYLVTLAARTRRSVAVGAALGVATADGGYALLAVVGGRAVAAVLEPVATPLRWTSAAVLVAIAVTIAGSAIIEHRQRTRGRITSPVRGTPATPGRAYAVLLAITCLNPTTLTYFAALVLGDGAGIDRAGPAGPVASAVFVAAAFAASASWQLALAFAGSALGRVVSGPRGRLVTAVVSSTMVIGLAAITALSV